jgi:hypothetical protein
LIRHYAALCTDVSRPITSSETRKRLATYCSSGALFAIDATVGIIDLITDLLMDCGDSSNSHRDLAFEFESLLKTFTLTRLTIQMYDGKPLGQSLANTITPEILQCFISLRELLDSVNGTRLGFHFTVKLILISYWSTYTSLQHRILITLSEFIPENASEVTSSSGVIMK